MGIKTKTVCVKKQRKVSKVQTDVASSDESPDILIEDSVNNQLPEDEHQGKNVISMESMVCLPDPSLNPLYREAIHKLKSGYFKQAEDNLLRIIRVVSQHGQYGEYSLHSRTGNKRTTLSALYMFLALTCEGINNVRRAIMFCNKAISEDPGWMIPFSKRSEYFKYFEEQLSKTSGGSNEDILRARISADIIVDLNAEDEIVNDDNDGARTVRSLVEALAIAKDGDKIFLEEGRYYREEGFSVTSRVSLTGASSSGCVIVSGGSPTIQICTGAGCGTSATPILLHRLQFHNIYSDDNTDNDDGEQAVTSSNAAHVYIISPDTVTVRDCLFVGGENKSGGILIAEEAFYRSLLELEFENPELLTGTGSGMSDKCLRLFVDFCIFSDCQKNCCLFVNNQATVIMSNSMMYNCGRTGISAGEGSSVSIINSSVSDCSHSCVSCDNVSTVNILGSVISDSGSGPHKARKHYKSGVVITEKSKANISRSLMKNHSSAVSVDDGDLVFDENCVMDIMDESVTEAGLQLDTSAIYISRGGNVVIQRNNFYNCNLVWQIQHGSAPRLDNNNIDTCLIGFISADNSCPRIENNQFQCVVLSCGMFIENSAGNMYNNTFKYVAKGLDIHSGCSPVLVKNVYKRTNIDGAGAREGDTSSLMFDIVKVKGSSDGVKAGSSDEVITVTEDSNETTIVEEIMRRKMKSENIRNCSNCGLKTSCLFKCNICDQIFYCSGDCRLKDKVRHKAFCNLSMKDLF